MRRSRGLTLVELLVGFLGLTLILNLLFASITGGLKVERTSDLRMNGVRLAASRRAVVEMTKFELLEPLDGVETVQVRGQDYRVETKVSREAGGSGPDGNEERYAVNITVRWKDGAREPSFSLDLKRSKL